MEHEHASAIAVVGLLSVGVLLAGCSTGDAATPPAAVSSGTDAGGDSHEGHDHSGHDHAGHDHAPDGGPAPEGMVEAVSPSHPVGSRVVLRAGHVPGMDGVTATVVGAFDTFTYSVDYTPTGGGDPVRDHRWVVHEELRDVGDERLADGDRAVLEAAHMTGMRGATATIAGSTDETTYMVDFEADGMEMTNHKWVVESEVEAVP